MGLTFDNVSVGDVLTFVTSRERAEFTRTARVVKITDKTLVLTDVTGVTDSIGNRPVRYRILRTGWERRQVRRTTPEGLPRRGTTNTSRVAAAALRPAAPALRTVVTVTTQGGPTRVHAAGCPDITLDARRLDSTPQTHQVVDRAGLIRPLVQDLRTEDPDLDRFDEEFRFLACCPRLPWRALGACFGHQPRHSNNPHVQHVVAALTKAGHVPATIVGDYNQPQPQATGFLALPRGEDQVYIAHLQAGHDLEPATRAFHHRALAAYHRTLTGHPDITVLGRPTRVLRTRITPTH